MVRRVGRSISWAREVAQWDAASKGSAQVRWWAGESSMMRGQVRGSMARWWERRRKAREREPGQAGSESGVRWERRARKRAQAETAAMEMVTKSCQKKFKPPETAAQPRRRSSLRPHLGRRSRQASPPRSFSPEVTISRSGEKLCTCRLQV